VDSSFSSAQYSGEYPCINGDFAPTFGATKRVENLAYTLQALPVAMVGMTTIPAPSGWMLDLVAGTNPSRPVVNIPELVEDLVSLPRAIRSLGNLLMDPKSKANPKGLSGEYLGVQFGWLPLIEDLTKLLNFQSYAIKRNKELHQLYSGKGLRRRLKFADDTVVTAVTGNSAVSTSLLSQACSLEIKRRQWATIHWWPTTLPPYHPDDIRWNLLATRLVLGATPEAMLNGIWKVIPWTWLLGWFTNFGKYTLANSWTVPAQHGSGCFMSEATASFSAAGVSVTNVFSHSLSTKGTAKRVLKSRSVSSTVTAGANIPYLDMFRLSILSALFVQKFSGRMGGLV